MVSVFSRRKFLKQCFKKFEINNPTEYVKATVLKIARVFQPTLRTSPTFYKMNTSEKIIVSVNEGRIRGFKNKSTFSGVEYYSFLGVPYGQSTAGYARFKDPVAVKPWKTILNANIEKGGCLQFSLLKEIIDGSEDCLYNNIHTLAIPQNNHQTLKAVIINIHPGSLYCGSPDPIYFGSPEFVMHNDIVYVCISFRIHILGFLNLDLKECSGNQGLKDIILSLQWIQKNIHNFGGDPSNITLLGSSSGAHIINELMISSRAKGLFHKAVIMGSYKYGPTRIVRDHNSTIAFELAQNLGYNGPPDKKTLLSFYKKLDVRRIIFARPDRLLQEGYAPIYPTSPFLPSPEFGENPVIPSISKEECLESMARIPLMIGVCQREAMMGFFRPFIKATMSNFYTSVCQNCWGWGSKLNESQLKLLRHRIDSYYLNGKSIEKVPLALKCDIQTDIALSDLYPSLIDVMAADCPSSVYVYKFEFEGNVKTMKNIFQFNFEEPLLGSYHGDDFSYWNCTKGIYGKTTETYTSETEEMIKTFTKLICTFAKTGNPNYDRITTQWKPTSVENPCYLSINNNLSMVDGKLNGERMEFWENLKKEIELHDSTPVPVTDDNSGD